MRPAEAFLVLLRFLAQRLVDVQPELDAVPADIHVAPRRAHDIRLTRA